MVAPDADGVYRSRAVAGFSLRVSRLWEDPLPAVDESLMEVAGEAYADYLIARLRQRGFLKQNSES